MEECARPGAAGVRHRQRTDILRDAANALALVGEALAEPGAYDAAAALPSDQLAPVAAIEQANIEVAKDFPAHTLALFGPRLDRPPSASLNPLDMPARPF